VSAVVKEITEQLKAAGGLTDISVVAVEVPLPFPFLLPLSPSLSSFLLDIILHFLRC
jgi:hypothetical protein